MSGYNDPQTTMTIARYARCEQIRRVAEHRRYLESTRSEPSVPDGRNHRWPQAIWSRAMSGGRRRRIPAGEATAGP